MRWEVCSRRYYTLWDPDACSAGWCAAAGSAAWSQRGEAAAGGVAAENLISFQVRTRDLRPRPSARRQLGVGNLQRQRALILPSSGRDHLFLFEIENEIAGSRRGGPRPSFLFQVDSEMAGRAAAARGKA